MYVFTLRVLQKHVNVNSLQYHDFVSLTSTYMSDTIYLNLTSQLNSVWLEKLTTTMATRRSEICTPEALWLF